MDHYAIRDGKTSEVISSDVEAIIILFLNVVQGKWPIFAFSSFAYIIERRMNPYKSTILLVMQILSMDIYCIWQNNLVGRI
jgi:hypothetical protein